MHRGGLTCLHCSFFVFVSKPTRRATDIQTATEASKEELAENRGLISGDGAFLRTAIARTDSQGGSGRPRGDHFTALLALLENVLVAHGQRTHSHAHTNIHRHTHSRLMPSVRSSCWCTSSST